MRYVLVCGCVILSAAAAAAAPPSQPPASVPAQAQAQAQAQDPPPVQDPNVAPPEQPAAPKLKFAGSVTAGVSLESGRTDLNAVQIVLQGRRPYSRDGSFTMGGTYTHGTTRPPGRSERFTVANHADASIGIEHNFGKRMVLMLRSQALRDTIQKIDYRFSEIVGLGVRLGTKRVQARIIPGLAFLVHDKNVAAENGFNLNYGLYQDLRITLPNNWTLTELISASHDVRDNSDLIFSGDVRLTGAITKRLGVQLSYHYDYEDLVPAGVEPRYQKIIAGVQISLGGR
jgi:hypothetical protein